MPSFPQSFLFPARSVPPQSERLDQFTANSARNSVRTKNKIEFYLTYFSILVQGRKLAICGADDDDFV